MDEQRKAGTNRRLVGGKRKADGSRAAPSGRVTTATTLHTPRPTPRPLAATRHYPAFTLLEVLLTLCVVALAAAMAWPTLDRWLAGIKLQKAAEGVRAEWISARIDALESGLAYRFYYNRGGSQYRIERENPDSQGTVQSAASQQGNQPSSSDSTALGLASSEAQQDFTLPEGVTFEKDQPPPAEDDATSDGSDAQNVSGSPGSSGSSSSSSSTTSNDPTPGVSSDGKNWDVMVQFYSDGTTDNARLNLCNNYQMSIALTLRGFTGVSTVGPISAEGEQR